jgi:hypothetical protein
MHFLVRVLVLVLGVCAPFLLLGAKHRREPGAGVVLLLPLLVAPLVAVAALLVYAPTERLLAARGLGHLMHVGVALAGAAAGVGVALVAAGRAAAGGRGRAPGRLLFSALLFGAVGAAGGLLWRWTDGATRGLAATGAWAPPSAAVLREPAALGDVPTSCYFLVAALVVFLLQALPVPGVFFMILGGAAWPGVLLNLGFAGVAYEVLAGGAARGWLALPALWFGGYALRAGSDWWALARLRREIARANAGVRVPFDRDAHALLVTEEHDETGHAEGTAAWLVERYDLGAAYARYGGAPTTHAWRLASAALAERVTTLMAQGRPVAARPASVDHPSGKRWRRAPVAGVSLLRVPDAPECPAVHVWHFATDTKRGTLPVRLVTTTIRMPDGSSYELRSGEARALARWPMPILGFALDSATPAWRRISYWPRRRVTLVDGGANAALARALGLAPAPPDARRAADLGATEAALAHLLAQRA